jgi:hypothetical protein
METKILSVHIAGGIGIVQLMTSEVDTFAYITGSAAIQKGLLEVKEVNAGGSVNTIYLHNSSDEYVFLMDGDILAGAKQNRVVNTSMLLAPHLGTKIPVSCVERGRWHHTSSTFRPTDYTAPHEMRSRKMQKTGMTLFQRGVRDADQGEVWGMVDHYMSQLNVQSSTANLSDSFEQKRRTIDESISKFPLHAGANGVAVFFGHRLMGVDVFHRRDVFGEYFPKILRAITLEGESLGRSSWTKCWPRRGRIIRALASGRRAASRPRARRDSSSRSRSTRSTWRRWRSRRMRGSAARRRSIESGGEVKGQK